MPAFFAPLVEDPDSAEKLWEATWKFQEEQGGGGLTPRRIFRLGYLHDGKHMEAEIGVAHPYARKFDEAAFAEVGPPQEVLVILERTDGLFYVCTWDRGVTRGGPILVGAGEPYEVTYFDGYGPDDEDDDD
jgi:hypothetical protein